jgi:hypothetical protein
LQSSLREGAVASDEPIIVVLGAVGGGTSAVAKVLDHLGVYMGSEFGWVFREPHDAWEDSRLAQLLDRALRGVPGGPSFDSRGQLQMDAGPLQAKFHTWARDHRHAASSAGSRPGVKHPLLCVAIDFIRTAWGPVVPVVVDRPTEKTVATLSRLHWHQDEQARAGLTEHLIAARDLALAGEATVRVDFEALRATPADVIRRLADQLHLTVTDAQVDAAVASVLQPTDVHGDADPFGIELLLAEVERNPEDAQWIGKLAKTYFFAGDFVNARKWFARQAEMGGVEEDVYHAMYRLAESMAQLDEPWPDVQDAFLRAWEFRPTRAEPLYDIARRYRIDKRYQLGYLFAERAARIPFPEDDLRFEYPDIYAWYATDEQAICAGWIGKKAEAFALNRRLLARADLPNVARRRIARNRDLPVPIMIEAAARYPDALVQRLVTGPRHTEVAVSLVAGPDPDATELTLNSFLRCCADVSRAGRFLVVDAGLSAGDRAMLLERYGFLEFADCSFGDGPGARLAQIYARIDARFWLHLGQGWRFFAPERFITRLTAVLEAEAQVFQVGINFADAAKLTGDCAAEHMVRRASDAGRYVLADAVASGPAMLDTTRLDELGGIDPTDPDPVSELRRRAAAAGLRTASLDEVLCISAI